MGQDDDKFPPWVLAQQWAEKAGAMPDGDLNLSQIALLGQYEALTQLDQRGLTQENLLAMVDGIATAMHAVVDEMRARGLGPTVHTPSASH